MDTRTIHQESWIDFRVFFSFLDALVLARLANILNKIDN